MALLNLKSDLSKFNKEFKSRNTFDSDKNNILDDSYKGKALVGTPLEINKTIEYQLKSKLVTEVSAPNNKSWRVPNPINIGSFYTPTSNYIDATKLFYGGNITPYSKGTPLEIVVKESKWKSFDYPTTVPTTPYSFLKPTGFTGNNDFSLPYENRYTTLTLGKYNRGTPLDVVNKDSKWTAFDYSNTKPFIFEKPTNFAGGNAFSLPYDKKYKNINFNKYGKYNVNPLNVASSFDINKDLIIDTPGIEDSGLNDQLGPKKDILFRSLLTREHGSWNVPNPKGGFSTPKSNYIDSDNPFYGGNIAPYSKGTPLDSIIKTSIWSSFDYKKEKPYSFLPPDGFAGNNDFNLPFNSYTDSRLVKYNKGTPLVAIGKESNLILYITSLSKDITIHGLTMNLGYTTPKTIYNYFGSWNVKNNINDTFYTAETNLNNNGFYPNITSYTNRSAKYTQGTPLSRILSDGKLKYKYDEFLLKTPTTNTSFFINYDGNVTKPSIVGSNENITTIRDGVIDNLVLNSVTRFGTVEQKWNSSDYGIIKTSHIPVGQVNDRNTIDYGNSYYNRIFKASDPLGLYNTIPNKAVEWSGPFTLKEQPFVFYLPPYKSGANPKIIEHNGITANTLSKLFIIAAGRRGPAIVKLRNNLGVRASDAILATSHFLTDIARRQSVKPELPVKLFSGAIAGVANVAQNAFSGFTNRLTGNTPPANGEFSDTGKNPLTTDLITFAIVYFDQDLNYSKSIQFKSYLTQFSETLSPDWQSGKFIGHPNNYYTYKGVTRSAQINFTIYSQNAYQREVNWKKINKLASMCYPQYSSGVDGQNRMQGPIIRLHLGSIYKGMPGFISTLTFTVNDNTPWDTVDRELPHGIEVNMGYTIIGHVLPEMDKNNHFDVYRNKRFDTGKGDYYKDADINELKDITLKNSMDLSGANELLERINRKPKDVISIAEETVGNGLPI